MRPRRPIQPFLLSTDQYFLHRPLVHIHPVPHLSLHTFFYCFASASFVRGLMPDRVSPVSITPHLLPLATQPQLHPISPRAARLLASSIKLSALTSCASFFQISRRPRPSRGRPPAAHGGQSATLAVAPELSSDRN